ncbi:MAG: PIG-L family deacetylase [Anaerolineales bacterium]
MTRVCRIWACAGFTFDDAILSCGGLIWEQSAAGMPVEIWTLCAGDPPAASLSRFAKRTHADWNTGTALETVALRRVEDRNAARQVGAVAHHFPIPDCIYRRHPVSGRALYTRTVFRAPARVEAPLAGHMAALIRSRLTEEDTLVCPLGLGRHIDHTLTRRAAEMLGRPLLYYADIPYLFKHPEQLPRLSRGLVTMDYSVSRDGLRAWQKGIAAYASQIGGLFPDVEAMRAAIKEYWAARRGIALWQPAAGGGLI